MEPLAIAVACWAVSYIVFRGPLLVTLQAWVVFAPRLMYSSTGHLRTFGAVMWVEHAAPLMVTAHQAQSSIAFQDDVFGWFPAAYFVRSIAAPGRWKQFLESFWDSVPYPPLLRARDAFDVAFGLFSPVGSSSSSCSECWLPRWLAVI